MTVKILTCKICGEEIESRRLWKLTIQVHLMKHKEVTWFQIPATELRKEYFTEKTVKEIDFNKYENVCITGGEPFLDKRLFYIILNSISEFKKVYIYTNGLLIDWNDIFLLKKFDNLKGINLGLHTIPQLKRIKPIEKYLPVRFCMNEDMKQSFLKVYKHRLNGENIKPWKMDDCLMPNEDWVLLKQN